MRHLENLCTNPHYNMAFDQFCLEELKCEEPVFYLWRNEASVIIGLNQNAYAEVNLPYLESQGIILARRTTGGGAVYHDLNNLNYTICGKSDDIKRDYPGYASLIAEALGDMGLNVELSGRNDILLDGRKVSGYAKRVYKDRLMVHGTLMFDVDTEQLTKALSTESSKLHAAGIASVRSRVGNLKEQLPDIDTVMDFKKALEDILIKRYDSSLMSLSAEELGHIQSLTDKQFGTWEWNYGHSPAAEFKHKKKFSCGTIELDFNIRQGRIRTMHISGDYIGNLPADSLANALEGVHYKKDSIEKALSGISLSAYFDSLSNEDFSALILGTD